MFAANSPYSPLVTSVAKVSNSVPAKFFLARIMVVILRRVIRPMLALRGDRPVSPTIPPRFGPAPDLFSGDGYILVLQPIGRQWADNELRMSR